MLDVNATRFHLLLGRDDWLPEGTGALEWADGTLRLRRRAIAYPPPPGRPPLTPDDRRGSAVDRFGNRYWISVDHREIHVQLRSARAGRRFWPFTKTEPEPRGAGFVETERPPARSPRLSGLAVTTEHMLVVGCDAPAGILFFDLYGGPPGELPWPDAIAFTAFDIAAGDDGGVHILDRANRRLWQLDRWFRVCGQSRASRHRCDDFTPLTSTNAAVPDVGQGAAASATITADAALALDETLDPISVDLLGDGSVVVLDRNDGHIGRIHRYARRRGDGGWRWIGGRLLDEQATRRDEDDDARLPLPAVGHDIAVTRRVSGANGALGTLLIAGESGIQTLAFAVTASDDDWRIALLPSLLPMHRFAGRALIAAGDQAYYDDGERFVPLVEQPRPRFHREAIVELPVGGANAPNEFDGRDVGCTWHRLLLDACIPQGCTVAIESRAADDAALLARRPWRNEPQLYRRSGGAELPYYQQPLDPDRAETGTWELLLQSAVGRYLQLRMTLRGSGGSSPRLYALRIYYPRFSYLENYLPAVFRDEPVAASFLDRYLANIEGLLTVLEGQIADVQVLFDPRTTSPAALDWLAGWFGAALDETWETAKRRLFIAHAARLFAERGTLTGIARMVQFAIAPCADEHVLVDPTCIDCGGQAGYGVRIVEGWRTRRAPGVVLGDPSDVLGPGSTSALIAGWSPANGAQRLHGDYRAFLARRYPSIGALNAAWGSTFTDFSDSTLRLAAITPRREAEAKDWLRFVRAEIGFTYAPVHDDDEPLFTEFLAFRYRQPDVLSAAYGLDAQPLASFADVRARLWDTGLRRSIPDGGVRLRDWIEFVSIVLPMRRSAHCFTVLIPVRPGEDPALVVRKRELTRRIVTAEKPAHTRFDVKLYYALFRVGEARVGLDTILGEGARSVALALDRDALTSAHLADGNPARGTGRIVLGDERGLGRSDVPAL